MVAGILFSCNWWHWFCSALIGDTDSGQLSVVILKMTNKNWSKYWNVRLVTSECLCLCIMLTLLVDQPAVRLADLHVNLWQGCCMCRCHCISVLMIYYMYYSPCWCTRNKGTASHPNLGNLTPISFIWCWYNYNLSLAEEMLFKFGWIQCE